MVEWTELDTALGRLFVACSRAGLCRLSFGGRPEVDVRWLESHFVNEEIRQRPRPGAPLLDQVEAELAEYLNGVRRAFTLPLDLRGTSFQRAVWQALLAVPYGQTISYGVLAARTGYPRAARAVGGAMRANPVAVVVPCHRVLPADGSLGCYGGGRERKRFLLQLEGAYRDDKGRP